MQVHILKMLDAIPVGSLSDQEKYEFLRGEGKHSKFTTIKVKKKGREVSLTFQSSWLQEFD